MCCSVGGHSPTEIFLHPGALLYAKKDCGFFFEVVTFLSIMYIISITVKTNQISYVRARTDHRVSVQLLTTAKNYLAVINFARKWNKTAY